MKTIKGHNRYVVIFVGRVYELNSLPSNDTVRMLSNLHSLWDQLDWEFGFFSLRFCILWLCTTIFHFPLIW